MTRAKDRAEFIESWEYEFRVLGLLGNSLPPKQALAYLDEIKKLQEKYLTLAADNSYPQGEDKRNTHQGFRSCTAICKGCVHLKTPFKDLPTECRGHDHPLWILKENRGKETTIQ